MSRRSVAKHLTSLEGAGLVTSQRHGREVRYQLVRTTVTEATAWLDEVGARWDERLESLRRHLGGP
jgi:DNA-binding transcriptional ArsR family regulator